MVVLLADPAKLMVASLAGHMGASSVLVYWDCAIRAICCEEKLVGES
jgi:hypothetical protein